MYEAKSGQIHIVVKQAMYFYATIGVAKSPAKCSMKPYPEVDFEVFAWKIPKCKTCNIMELQISFQSIVRYYDNLYILVLPAKSGLLK